MGLVTRGSPAVDTVRPTVVADGDGRLTGVQRGAPDRRSNRRIARAGLSAELRHILVVSDASTDRTDEIVRSYAERGVELLRLPTRSGKTAAENAACARLRGEVVVNSDASIRLHPAAIRRLVARPRGP